MVKKLIPSALSKAAAALLLAAAWWSWGGQEMPDGMVRVTDRTASGQPNVVPWLAGTEEMSARGDFDGDGALDEAYFVQRGETYALVAAKSDGKAPTLLVEGIPSLRNYGVRTLPPGRYLSWCTQMSAHKGRDICSEDELRELTTTHDSIELVYYESAASMFYWENGRLHRMWTSD